jgi:hypothetical protein
MRGRWQARAKRDGRLYHLGTYGTPEEAAQVAHLWRLENLPGYTGRDIAAQPRHADARLGSCPGGRLAVRGIPRERWSSGQQQRVVQAGAGDLVAAGMRVDDWCLIPLRRCRLAYPGGRAAEPRSRRSGRCRRSPGSRLPPGLPPTTRLR